MAAYSPPFTLTHAMLSRVAEIAELVGQWRSTQSSQVPMLRRENRIRTIQASLAIEHNTLSLEQVTAVIVHIPVENEHLFRFKMNADSGLRVHRFRTPQCTYSDVR
ncbi:hypothetical protein RE654_05675 [Aeromonas caviae]|uniref:hypothetical protein n=1 Tax=Aeromonas caviae TaxID=648 RepID=UPI002868CEB7|nr:hypothetical protein [Aeromonas caviae]WMX35724.1 hypothetical protein RE654_05675 [Aeromonas caviae]